MISTTVHIVAAIILMFIGFIATEVLDDGEGIFYDGKIYANLIVAVVSIIIPPFWQPLLTVLAIVAAIVTIWFLAATVVGIFKKKVDNY